jgi:uncharacterized protein
MSVGCTQLTSHHRLKSLQENSFDISMKTSIAYFDEHEALHELKHLLPAQAPLKDFVHHNTLHAFQHFKFHSGIHRASEMFGYKVYLSLNEFRSLYRENRISTAVLDKMISDKKGAGLVKTWKEKMLNEAYPPATSPRIGQLRANWKKLYRIDLDSLVHPNLFRILCSYLDQGISMWNFPVWHKGFLSSLREIERNSFTSFFKTKRARTLFLNGRYNMEHLLNILVEDEKLYKQYLFDQQFAHQGWSGIVSTIEDQPHTLLDAKKITLHDLIIFELLLEIDALDFQFGEDWLPLSNLKSRPTELFAAMPETELHEVLALWQEAFEWTYYDQVLAGIQARKNGRQKSPAKNF